jgi:serine/threonine-protein kinase
VEDVCERLSSSLDGVRDRDEILRDVRATLLRPAGGETSAPPGEAALPPHGPTLSEEDLARVKAELARYIGPIATLLVKRAAPQAASVADLRQRLAVNLENPADRAAFTAGS